ncbi:MAG TPA: GntR family transcriptional regulator [Pseudonocardia sp.]|uniref:GntR family transcriptional regulator n=1 Tax=Pseudonocardia sp. TaxID=60912 RepID=UPI002D054963|nr:GntR family transcriptional regulator [Pseudonocardia sp.]HTF45972.1 GntR family transcriptional regulator [Pseudonocardia sp.]
MTYLSRSDLTMVEASGLAEEIAYRLRADILDGKLPLGSRLRHEDLAERFGVSRTPIREALRQLQALNLVDVRTNRGATVRVPTRAELVEVYELRANLEGFACQLAASRATSADLDELERAQAQLHGAVEAALSRPADTPLDESEFDARLADANGAFHAVVHRASGNRRLHDSILDLQRFFPRDSVWRAIAHDRETMRQMNIHEHEAIAAALRARAGSASSKAMRDHVQAAGEILLGYLDNQRFWG